MTGGRQVRLGLLAPAVDVHAAQWGILARLVEAGANGLVPYGIALDENTALSVADGTGLVRGVGRARLVRPGGDGATVSSHLPAPGDTEPVRYAVEVSLWAIPRETRRSEDRP